MSFILKDIADESHDIQVSGWSWRPTMALLIRAGIIPTGDREVCCLAQGCGGYFTHEEVMRTVEFLDGVLSNMNPGERMFEDRTTTGHAKDYTKPVSQWDDEETFDHYSASYEWLCDFRDFCRRAKGFRVL